MSLYILALYLAVGSLGGLFAGLFGIGGGIIIVPALIVTFQQQQMAPEVVTHLAIGTSLACILFTGISSLRGHLRRTTLPWPLVLQLSGGMVVGALLGGLTAGWLSGRLLQILIGLFALSVAVQMALDLRPRGEQRAVGRAERWLAGGLIGWASALFGIGGGSLTVPYLTWRAMPMAQAVAISAACGIPIAFTGGLSFIINGWDDPALPPHAFGYVYWPAWLGVVLTSAPLARVGVSLAHRLPADTLRRLFALLLLLVGGKFLISSL